MALADKSNYSCLRMKSYDQYAQSEQEQLGHVMSCRNKHIFGCEISSIEKQELVMMLSDPCKLALAEKEGCFYRIEILRYSRVNSLPNLQSKKLCGDSSQSRRTK
jgi:hypothetical protein